MSGANWRISMAGITEPSARIYCFVHAGGDPRTFLPWQEHLAPAEVVALCPPGRGPRAAESAPVSVEQYADEFAGLLAADADRPFYLFGHSFGGLVAFEVARRLTGRPGLMGLIASGCSAPRLMPTPRIVQASGLQGRDLAQAMDFFGGIPAQVLADEDLQELLLGGLRSDLRLAAAWKYRPGRHLHVPIALINGSEDAHVTDQALVGWSEVSTAGVVANRRAPGGHFYFESDPAAVVELLQDRLRSDRLDVAYGEAEELI